MPVVFVFVLFLFFLTDKSIVCDVCYCETAITCIPDLDSNTGGLNFQTDSVHTDYHKRGLFF